MRVECLSAAQPHQVGKPIAANSMLQSQLIDPPVAMPPGVPPAPRRMPPNKGGSNELPQVPAQLSSNDELGQRLMEISHAQRHEAASAIQRGASFNRLGANQSSTTVRELDRLRFARAAEEKQLRSQQQEEENLRLRSERLARARTAATNRQYLAPVERDGLAPPCSAPTTVPPRKASATTAAATSSHVNAANAANANAVNANAANAAAAAPAANTNANAAAAPAAAAAAAYAAAAAANANATAADADAATAAALPPPAQRARSIDEPEASATGDSEEGSFATSAQPITEGGVSSMVRVPPLAAPELGSCTSSGRAWWPRAARHSQGRGQATGRPATPSRARASRLRSRQFSCL